MDHQVYFFRPASPTAPLGSEGIVGSVGWNPQAEYKPQEHAQRIAEQVIKSSVGWSNDWLFVKEGHTPIRVNLENLKDKISLADRLDIWLRRNL